MSFHGEPLNHAPSRRLADSNRCFDPRPSRQRSSAEECEWCGAETASLQEHPRLQILVCDDCAAPPPVEKPPEPEPPETWIYFIQAGGKDGPVKIGVADNPQYRLRQMQTGNHLSLRLVRKMRGTIRDELALHRACAQWRIRGEWFEAEALEALRRNRLWGPLTQRPSEAT